MSSKYADKQWQEKLFQYCKDDNVAALRKELFPTGELVVTQDLSKAKFQKRAEKSKLLGSLLVEACWSGSKDCVAVLVKTVKKEELDRSYWFPTVHGDYTPLGSAGSTGQHACCRIILDAGGEVNSRDSDGETALHKACFHGHNSVVKLLIDAHDDLGKANKYGKTALHVACFHGHDSVVKLLIDAHADLGIANKDGETALHAACVRGHDSVVKLLIDANADLGIANKNGNTALHVACVRGHDSVVKLLIDANADLGIANKYGKTALHVACFHGHDSVVKLLIDAHADLGIANKDGETALHAACVRGHDSVVKLLIDANADLGIANKNGNTALHVACVRGHDSVVKLLIDANADLGIANKNGNTALHVACVRGHDPLVKLLINANADLGIANKDGETALHVACYTGHDSVVKLLINAHVDLGIANKDGETALHVACHTGHDSVVKLLIDAHADLGTVKKYGKTALHVACFHGHDSGVKLLIDANADLGVADEDGETALHFACYTGHDSVVKLLINAHADLGIANKDGETALHVACFHGHDSVVKLLIDAHADLGIAKKDGETALHSACFHGHDSVVKLLIDAHADLGITDEAGRTPLDTAAEWARKESCTVILKHVKMHYRPSKALELTKPGCDAAAKAYKPACAQYIKNFRQRLLILVTYFGDVEPAIDLSVTVIGGPGRGKSTLLRTIKARQKLLLSLLRRERQADQDADDSASRTQGVEVSTYTTAAGHVIHFLDLAGQEDFAGPHSILYMDGGLQKAAIIVADGKMTREDLQKDLSDSAGKLISKLSDDSELLKAIVVFTRKDIIDSEKEKELSELFVELRHDVGHLLDLQFHCVVDARKSRQDPTADFVQRFEHFCSEALKGKTQPCLLRTLRLQQAALRKEIKLPFCQLSELKTALFKIMQLEEEERDSKALLAMIDEVIDTMSVFTMVLLFRKNPALADIVVIDPSWLLHTISGGVFSPESFPAPHVNFKHGVLEKKIFLKDLSQIPAVQDDGETVCKMLLDLGLILEKEGFIVAPGKLAPARSLLGSWEEDDDMEIFCGHEFTCEKPTFFATGVSIRLQCTLFAYFSKQHERVPYLYRHVINVKPGASLSEGCVVFSPEGLRAWVLVRAPKGNEHDAYYLLRFLTEKLEQEVANTSPGSRYVRSVVSSSSLRKQVSTEGNVLDTYPLKEIARRHGDDRVRSRHHSFKDHVSDLLFCNPGHLRVFSQTGRRELHEAVANLNVGYLAADLRRSHPDRSLAEADTAMGIIDTWAAAGNEQTAAKLEHQLSASGTRQSYGLLFKALRSEEERISRALPDVFLFPESSLQVAPPGPVNEDERTREKEEADGRQRLAISPNMSRDACDLLNKVDFGDKLAERMNYEEKMKFARFVVEKCGKYADNFNEILRCYLEEQNLGVGQKEASNVTGVLFYFASSNPLLTMKDLYDVVMMSCPRQQEQIVHLIRTAKFLS